MSGVIASAVARIFDPVGTGTFAVTAMNAVTGALATATLPAIGNPPAAGQCAFGAIAIVRGDSHYGGILIYPSGVQRRVGQLEVVVLFAEEDSTWKEIANASGFESAAIGLPPKVSGGGTLGLGAAGTVPTQIVTPGAPKWFIPKLAPDGTIAFEVLWQ